MKITLKSIYIFLFLLLPALTYAAANTYYVTQTGSGDRMSIAEFNALSGGGYAGDTFYFSGTFTTRVTVHINGTSGNPVTLDGYEAGDCDPLNSVCSSSALLNQGMRVYPTSYVIVQDFRMTMTGSGTTAAFNAWPTGVNYFTFKRNYINDTSCRGFQFGYWGGAKSHHIIIDENKFMNFSMRNTDPGECTGFVVISSENILVSKNIMGHDGGSVGCSEGCNTITIHDTNDFLFEYNEVYGAPQQAGIATKELLGAGQDSHIYRFNKLHDNGEKGLNMGGGKDNLSNFYMYGNLMYKNPLAGGSSYDTCTNHYWWSNIFHDNGDSGFLTWDRGAGSPTNINLINNTFSRNGGSGPYPGYYNKGGIVFEDSGGSNFMVKNNLFYNNRETGALGAYHQIYESGKSPVIDHNTFYHSLASPTIYYNGTIRDTAYMEGIQQKANVAIEGPIFIFNDPDGADNTHGTDDDDYTLHPDSAAYVNDGADLSKCFYVNLSGGDSWFETQTGYSTVEVCFDDALDPNGTDWTTTPPTVATVKRDTAGWTRGAYAYYIKGLEKPKEEGLEKPTDITPPAPPNPWIAGSSSN